MKSMQYDANTIIFIYKVRMDTCMSTYNEYKDAKYIVHNVFQITLQ